MRVEPAHAFLALAASFGLAFLWVTPPLQTPDEIGHLLRSYRLSEAGLLPDRAEPYAQLSVPRSVARLGERLSPGLARHPELRQDLDRLRAELRLPLEPDQRVLVGMRSVYSPLPYLGPAVAIALCRALGAPAVLFVYAGRAMSLLLFVVLGVLALRLAGEHLWPLLGVSLLPMSVAQAAALGADAWANAFALLFVALILRARRVRSVFGPREGLLLAVVAAAVGLGKPVYWPIVGLIALVPSRRFVDETSRVLGLAAAVGLSAVPMFAWSFVIGGYAILPMGEGADPTRQLAGIVSQPLAMLWLGLRTSAELALPLFESTVGVLGQVDVRLPWVALVGYAGLLGSLALVPEPGRTESLSARLTFLVLAAALYALVLVSAYVGWTPVGADAIHGLQGRYFLPFAMLPLMALGRARLARWHARLRPVWLGGLALGLGVALVRLYLRYWSALDSPPV